MTVSTEESFEARATLAIHRLLQLSSLDFEFENNPENRAPRIAFGLFMNLAHQVHALTPIRQGAGPVG